MWSKLLILAAVLAPVAHGACANDCSGNGRCNAHSACECYRNWMGNDCSERVCYFDRAFVDTPQGDLDSNGMVQPVGNVKTMFTNTPTSELFAESYGLGAETGTDMWSEAHFYAECSGKGTCSRQSGQCTCFQGYEGEGCTRLSCPTSNDQTCSGHGTCQRLVDMYDDYQSWDATKTQQCVCDPGYNGIACDMRVCPSGDDPITKYERVITLCGDWGLDTATIDSHAGASVFGTVSGSKATLTAFCRVPVDEEWAVDGAKSDCEIGDLGSCASTTFERLHANSTCAAQTYGFVPDSEELCEWESNGAKDAECTWNEECSFTPGICNAVGDDESYIAECFAYDETECGTAANCLYAASSCSGGSHCLTESASLAECESAGGCHGDGSKGCNGTFTNWMECLGHVYVTDKCNPTALGIELDTDCDSLDESACALEISTLVAAEYCELESDGSCGPVDESECEPYGLWGYCSYGAAFRSDTPDFGIEECLTVTEEIGLMSTSDNIVTGDFVHLLNETTRMDRTYREDLIQLNEMQMLTVASSFTNHRTPFALTYVDEFGASYTTRTIECWDDEGTDACRQQIESSLEDLPNSVIPDVDVLLANLTTWQFSIDFISNTGDVNMLGTVGQDGDGVHHGDNYMSPSVLGTFVEEDRKGSSENVMCSNRGTCDFSTGICKCFQGFTKHDCSRQNVLAMY